jgi:hypothetical protein
MRITLLPRLLFSFLVSFGGFSVAHAGAVSGASLEKGFASPPDTAAPRTWWHWINGNVTKAGITADLEAMKHVGTLSATICVVDLGIPAGPIHYGTPEFLDMVKFAASEAKRLGITVGLENCAGWSSSGGPWVTPEYSMQEVVTSEKTIDGPAAFSGALPQPLKRQDYYRDIRVVAFPALDGDDVNLASASPTITASVANFHDPKSHGYLLPYATAQAPQYLQFEFPHPYEVRTVKVDLSWDDEGNGNIQVSDDGQNFRTVRPINLNMHTGVQTYAIAPTSARFFRIAFSRTAGRGAPAMVIPSVDFLAAPRIDNYLPKCDGGNSRMEDNQFDTGNTPTPPDSMVIRPDKMVDLTSKMDATGKLTWNVPAGKWTVLRVGYTTIGMVNHPAPPEGLGLECDKLSRTAAKVFWNGMLTKVTKYLGPLTGTSFTHTLIDSYEVGCQNWSPVFAQEFRKRRGYDLLNYLPVFTGRIVESPAVSERILWDVRRTIADLFADNYFGYFAQLSHQSRIKLELEPYGDGPFDNILSGRDADRVMGEFWWPGGDMGSVKLAASIGHIYGKGLVGAESFTSGDGGWDMSPPTMKTLGDRAFTSGINCYTFHRYCMQPWLDRWPGMTMGPFGSNIDRTNTWYSQAGPWLRYVTRCQYLLQQGQFVGDVLFFEGEGAPSDSVQPPRSVLPEGYDFDTCDTGVILHRLTVRNGNLVLPDGATYRALQLPDTKKMTPVLLRKIKELADAGATILGPKPELSPSLVGYPQCDGEVKKLATELWDGGKIVSGKPLPEVLASLKVQPDFESADPVVKLLYIHRRAGNNDLYFISNQADAAQETDGLFRVTGKVPEFWHADTGKIEKVAAYSQEDGRTRIPLRLDPAGSIFVVFRGDNPPPANHPVSLACTDAGAAPADTLEIRKAVYGAVEGSGSDDVAAKLSSMIRKGSLHVEASNVALGNDPAPEVVKQLRVDYTLNGVAGTKTVPENAILDIAAPRALFPRAQLHTAGKQVNLEAWQSGTYSVKMADGQTKTVPVSGVAQPVEVAGPWTVTFPPNWGAPASVTLDKLISWTDSPDSGVKYFSGTATYTKTVSISADLPGAGHHLYLDLGNVEVMAHVTLNGKDLGILWKPPYRVDITCAAHAGDNALEVKVTNLWPNRVIGDEQLPEDSDRNSDTYIKSWPQWFRDGKPSPTGRFTFATVRHWRKSDPLFPSGIIGPVTIRQTSDTVLP